eukprot:scaffold1335_cov102-Isochrysis_galbana.AAC.12
MARPTRCLPPLTLDTPPHLDSSTAGSGGGLHIPCTVYCMQGHGAGAGSAAISIGRFGGVSRSPRSPEGAQDPRPSLRLWARAWPRHGRRCRACERGATQGERGCDARGWGKARGGKRAVPWPNGLGGPALPTLTLRRRGVASHPKRGDAVPRRMMCPQCNGARRAGRRSPSEGPILSGLFWGGPTIGRAKGGAAGRAGEVPVVRWAGKEDGRIGWGPANEQQCGTQAATGNSGLDGIENGARPTAAKAGVAARIIRAARS